MPKPEWVKQQQDARAAQKEAKEAYDEWARLEAEAIKDMIAARNSDAK